MASLSPPPSLNEKYSGIPLNLLEKAKSAKAKVYENQTKKIAQRKGLALPPGISQKALLSALSELATHLGQEHVQLNDLPFDDGWYMEHPNTHDAFSLLDEEHLVASAIVYPGSTEQVQTVVRWANAHKIPIYPISMGRNLGYGGAAPRVRGSVVLDLGKRMNSILDINPNDCTCLLEPGVSFYALYEAIKAKGYNHLWIDCPDLGGGSVLGNTIDRGVGYTPYGDHWAQHAGLEVVLPTGDVIRTGMGAMAGSNTWQAFPYGFGPTSDGIFSQSNMGIVTKMGMTLMPNPGGHESYMYTFEKEEDLPLLIDIIRPLRIANILENVAQLKYYIQEVAALGNPRSNYYTGKGQTPEDVLRREAEKLPCGKCTWIYYGTAYGPAHIRKHKLELIHREFMSIPNAKKIDPDTILKSHYFWARDRISSGTPDLQEIDWLNWVPNGGHCFFSPISPTNGSDAQKLLAIARQRHAQFGIDLFPAFCIGLREIHLIINIVYDRSDASSKRAAYGCMRAMIGDAAKEGYGEYRTHLVFQDQVAQTYGWNDGALMKFNERIKDALDPNCILAPGRCGIWPKSFRDRGLQLGLGGRNKSSEERIVAEPGRYLAGKL
ncbi:hypothetical protein IFR04_008125 [Cadophora malorum]|uniref:FAD-binding PCMH-type domain-containing protein n=1 Tax=Cadophora malorum TaxID=108018 RepID=A0A8H7TH74_9HELO|nr:hypothetical protein IFR04_008125 [Cadophora malorum]